MGLLSYFQRKNESPSKPERDSVEAARVRARRRLIGATVLVALGVIGFPLVFDTAPRPLPVDIPIEIPRKDSAPALVAPPALLTESAADAGRAPVASAPAAKESAKAEVRPPVKPVEKAPEPSGAARSKPEPAADRSAKTATDASRAQAALEDKPAATPEPAKLAEAAGRFVVQVGAYSEVESAREARQRAEKLGLKTYTQVVDTSSGKRIRVRVGPYGDRGEAEKAAAQLKQAGLPSAVLTL